MRLIYAQGFSKQEKEEWRAIIFNNILSAFKVILDAMEELGIEFDVKENDVSSISLIFRFRPLSPKQRSIDFANQLSAQQYISVILVDCDLGPKDPLPTQYLRCFKALWADAGVQRAIEKGNEFALHDNLN